MDFTPQQKYSLLSKMGYTGSMQGDEMDAFLQSNPGAAAKMGKFDRAMKRGFQTGGVVEGGIQSPTGFTSPTSGARQELASSIGTLGAAEQMAVPKPEDPGEWQWTHNEVQNWWWGSQQRGVIKNSKTGAVQYTNWKSGSDVKEQVRQEAQPLVEQLNAPYRQYQEDLKKYNEYEKQRKAQNLPTPEEAQQSFTQAQENLQLAQAQQAALTPSAREVTTQAITDPTSLVTQAQPSQMVATPDQMVSEDVGTISGQAPQITTTTVDSVAQATTPTATPAATMQASTVAPQVGQVVGGMQAVQGQITPQSLVQAAQGELSPGALADGAKYDEQFIQTVEASNLNVTPDQLVTAQGQDAIAPAAKIAQSSGIDPAVAAQGTVSVNELPEPAQIKESEIAQAQAVVSGGQLSQDATAVAAKLDTFTVDNGTLAEAVQGNVNAQDTVQGQLANLMLQFDDGTPVWAAGAMRAANAAMAARGLGGSSMAGSAILQAAMESAIPIAAQDAQVFQQMNLSNLDRSQQVALANAAAQQGLSLQNLNNEQQAALQNSANAFQLQAQDLSNMQQTLIANAQIKSALQGQNLSNRQQANLAVAARYAEVANMNLNNRQQTALQNNANNLQVELSNLSNRQQSYIANAQLEAALQNQVIDNQQQAAVLNAARISEAANIQFNAEQQAKLHNSELMKTIGLAELNAEQAAILQNAAQVASMDMANLNNRQQAAVQNAQNFLQMDMANLDRQQQTAIFQTQQRVNALLSDQAAENAARQFNAASENQTNQFFADLASTTSRFNADQTNAINQFNAGQTNAVSQFNANLQAQRDQFNANNRLVVAQANAKWRQDIATLNTAAQNEAIFQAAKTANALTATAMDEIWQRERDLMSYAWQSSENAKDRSTNLIIADKQIAAEGALQASSQAFADNQGEGAVFGNIAAAAAPALIDGLFGLF